MSDHAAPRRITPQQWSLLEPLVDAALDLAPDRRPAFYDAVAANDPTLRAELERLVGRSGDADDLFSSAAAERFAVLLDGTRAPGVAVDIVSQLQASLGAAYALERELGGGGMSRVFLAHEAELRRRVVIKVLPPELAAGINAERFDREIKLAASLQQANIVPVLATGRAAGYPYYTMPFVEGRSLRDRLTRDGVLPIGDGVNLLRDVARALAYAHAHGVVHRDIKPGNVLLSGGTAVVTDFGIAKAISAAKTGADPEDHGATAPSTVEGPAPRDGNDRRTPALTAGGSSIGTPPYMAPEQAAGDPGMDHRADIYAFGCLAYEVFTGKPPFQGDAAHEIITAHLQETPRPVTEGRSDVPSAIASLISQCLEKNPRRRPQSAAELLGTLDAVSSGPTIPARRRSPAGVARAAVLALAIVVAAAAYLSYRGARAGEPNATDPLTLAAIPFRNVTRDSVLEPRAEGISDEILTTLGKVPGIQIVGRNAARQFRERDVDERVVQRKLGAVFLLTGTYQERGDRIVVSAQLNDSLTGRELWGDSFEGAPGDFRSLADSIARAASVALRSQYADRIGEPKPGAVSANAIDTAALDNYLIGQKQLRQRGPFVRQSVQSFEAAIRLDPNFARAHAALATALTFYPWFYGVPTAELKDSVISTARRALALDSTLADATSAIALAYAGSGEWEKAATEFDRAIRLEPNNFDVHFNYGRISTIRGDLPQALREFEKARRLEPTSPLVSAWTSYIDFLNDEVGSALEKSERAVRLDAALSPVTNFGALVNLAAGRPDSARRLIALQRTSSPVSTAPYVYAKLGDTATANRFVKEMESSTPRTWALDVQRASIMLAIGDTAGTLSALERSADASGAMWVWVISPRDRAYDPVRHSRRFVDLVRRAGLDTVWVTAGRR